MGLRVRGELSNVHELEYLDAGRHGRIERERLQFLAGSVDGLPDELDALILASDLQGREMAPGGRGGRFLGIAVAEELLRLGDAVRLGRRDRVGVCLCGDLFVVDDLSKRGGAGDVRDIWRAFAERFAWVAGVSGNHDGFGSEDDHLAFMEEPGINFLDGTTAVLGALRIGGVSGVVGANDWPRQQQEDPFEAQLRRVVHEKPDVLLLHQSPDGMSADRRGHPAVSRVLRELGSESPLTVVGHRRWPEPVVDLWGGQIVNAHERVIMLTREPASR